MSIRWERRWWQRRRRPEKLSLITDDAVWVGPRGEQRVNVRFVWDPSDAHTVRLVVTRPPWRDVTVMVDRELLANGGGAGDVKVTFAHTAVCLELARVGLRQARLNMPIGFVTLCLWVTGLMVPAGEERTPFDVGDSALARAVAELARDKDE